MKGAEFQLFTVRLLIFLHCDFRGSRLDIALGVRYERRFVSQQCLRSPVLLKRILLKQHSGDPRNVESLDVVGLDIMKFEPDSKCFQQTYLLSKNCYGNKRRICGYDWWHLQRHVAFPQTRLLHIERLMMCGETTPFLQENCEDAEWRFHLPMYISVLHKSTATRLKTTHESDKTRTQQGDKWKLLWPVETVAKAWRRNLDKKRTTKYTV